MIDFLANDGWISVRDAAAYEAVTPHALRLRIKKRGIPTRQRSACGPGRPGLEIPVDALSIGARRRYLADLAQTLGIHEDAEPAAEVSGFEPSAPLCGQPDGARRFVASMQGSPKARARLRRNLALCKAAAAARADSSDARPVKARLADVAAQHGVSLRTVQRIVARERQGASLKPRWDKPRQEQGRLDADACEFLKAAYLDAAAPTIVEVAEAYEREFSARLGVDPTALASRATIWRYLKALPDDEKVFTREGAKSWLAQCAPRLRRDASLYTPNQWRCGDSREFDVFVFDEHGAARRPWIAAWLDMRTREFTGYALSFAPNQIVVAKSFVNAVGGDGESQEGYGLPTYLLTDRGKDYLSHSFAGGSVRTKGGRCANLSADFKLGLEMLDVEWEPLKADSDALPAGIAEEAGVQQRLARPRAPWAKPIEAHSRCFKRLERRLPGYCGADDRERPEKLKAEIEGGKLLHFDQFAERVAKYVTAHNCERPQKELGGLAPAEVRDRYYQGVRPVGGPRWETPRKPDAETLQMLLWRKKIVTIRAKGLTLLPRHVYYSADMAQYDGRRAVACWDPDHPAVAYLYEAAEAGGKVYPNAERYLCAVPSLESAAAGMTESEIATVERYRRKREKELMRSRESAQASVSFRAAKEQLEAGLKPKKRKSKLGGPTITTLPKKRPPKPPAAPAQQAARAERTVFDELGEQSGRDMMERLGLPNGRDVRKALTQDDAADAATAG